MNVVKIMGGLGNQLFQYAFAKSLEKYGEVGLDISFYSSPDNHTDIIPERQFMLDKFNCQYVMASGQQYTPIWEGQYDSNIPYDNSYFIGYWQKPTDALSDLKLKDEYVTDAMIQIAEEMENCNSVAVHVRRTDYISLGHSLDLDYYYLAIDGINQRFKNAVFYIFSDDLKWCMDNICLDCDVRFVSIGDYQDFYLMSKSKHNIIANSTFSFWAAYMNKHKNIVIAPKKWLGEKIPSPLSVDGWILI